jgi:hypothetical protein
MFRKETPQRLHRHGEEHAVGGEPGRSLVTQTDGSGRSTRGSRARFTRVRRMSSACAGRGSRASPPAPPAPASRPARCRRPPRRGSRSRSCLGALLPGAQQRGCEASSRSIPAQAIIAALSVQSAQRRGEERAPAAATAPAGPDRPFAATPPATAKADAPGQRQRPARSSPPAHPPPPPGTRRKGRRRSCRAARPSRPRPHRAPAARRLQAGEDRSHPGRSSSGRGKAKARGIAPRGLALHRRPAGLGQAQKLRRLVEGLARRVVDGAAEAGEILRPGRSGTGNARPTPAA